MQANVFICLEFLRKTLFALPGVTEKLCYGTPAFYVNNKLFTRIREDGETLMVNSVERDKWMQAKPNIYFITNHYLNYNCMLVKLDKADPQELKTLLLTAWQNRATKKLIKEYEENFI